MITQKIYLDKYDWIIKIYYVSHTYPQDIILRDLEKLHCEYLNDVEDLMINSPINSGFTYTTDKHTIIVIGPCSSKDQFANTLDHEKGHAVTHICQYYNIDPYGEEKQHLAGKVAEESFKVARLFLCDCEEQFSCNI